jgi:hypothetical protein
MVTQRDVLDDQFRGRGSCADGVRGARRLAHRFSIDLDRHACFVGAQNDRPSVGHQLEQ